MTCRFNILFLMKNIHMNGQCEKDFNLFPVAFLPSKKMLVPSFVTKCYSFYSRCIWSLFTLKEKGNSCVEWSKASSDKIEYHLLLRWIHETHRHEILISNLSLSSCRCCISSVNTPFVFGITKCNNISVQLCLKAFCQNVFGIESHSRCRLHPW